MPPHHRVREWIARNYKKPTIDQEWLTDCSAWISSELGLDPDRNFDAFIQHVEAQLLQSNLADSTVPGSGIDPLLVASPPEAPRPRPSNARRPGRQATRQNLTTGPTPLLVEIKNITEIAHSAFSLLNTHQTRLDRADLGLAREPGTEQHRDEDEGPVPRFPRGMLRFELSDGLTTFRAIEFRHLPQLELGTTPLGYKLILKSTPIRSGIAFLQPGNVALKGYSTEDHDVNREQVFLSSLRKRLGRPDPPPEPVLAQPPEIPPQQPPGQRQPSSEQRPPSPPADLDDMYIDDDVDPDVLREMAIQMDEAIDVQDNRRVRARPSPSNEGRDAGSNPRQALQHNTVKAPAALNSSSTPSARISPYFISHPSDSERIPDIGLSPRLAPSADQVLDFEAPEPSNSLKKLGSTSTIPAKLVIPHKRGTSPDPYDELSFDMDVDESFLEQVGMIEKGALDTSTSNNGKGKAKETEATESYGTAARKRMLSYPAPGALHLVPYPVPVSGAKPSTRAPSNKERATSASSLRSSTESCLPQSTQSTDRRLLRDPSLFIISSEDEAQGCLDTDKPLNLARRHVKKGKAKEMGRDELANPDVIDISD